MRAGVPCGIILGEMENWKNLSSIGGLWYIFRDFYGIFHKLPSVPCW